MKQQCLPEVALAASGSLEAHQEARRRLLKGLVSAAVALPSLLLYQQAGATGKANPIDTTDALDMVTFLAFSTRVTGVQHFNPAVARKIFDLFKKEPWGLNHLQRIEDKLAPSVTSQNLATLDQGEHWFFGHFLTTWITGIYYHSSGNIMVSYEHALMHSALQDIRPIPGMSTREFGFWSQPPHTGEA